MTRLVLFLSFLFFISNAYADDIRDVKGPVSIPGSPWLLWVILLVCAAVVFLLFHYWQRNRSRFTKPVVLKTAWDSAYERLEELKRRDLFSQGKVKEYFVELSGIARQYIEKRFDIHAPEMTTEEFLNYAKQLDHVRVGAQRAVPLLADFLKMCDMVKFAKYGPDREEAQKSFDLVRQFIDETKVEGTGG